MNLCNETTEAPEVLIAYHANCIDGFTAAWVVARVMRKEGRNFELIAMEYNAASDAKLLKAAGYYKELYIVDFSLSVAILDNLSECFPALDTILLDHHKTAFEKYAPDMSVCKTSCWHGNISGTHVSLDNNHSGASLAWMYFYPGKDLPLLIKYVQDYDLWRFNLGEQTKWVNKFLSAEPKSIDNWEHLYDIFRCDETAYVAVNKGFKLQEAHNGKVEVVAAGASGLNLCGHSGLAVACPAELVSDVGHALAVKCGTFGAMYIVEPTANKVKWSLRSNDDFDVSAIAKHYGGGGHKNAAGFETALFRDGQDLLAKMEGEFGE